jgi:hypothetical protein
MGKPWPGRFLLQIGRVQHHQSRQFERRLGRDNLSAESPLHQKRQPSAMIEMGVGQQHKINRARVKPERDRVFLFKLMAALKQTAINQDAAAANLQQMA